MQRASESIGALAAALARAQIHLVNPEKSLVATIREEGRPERAVISLRAAFQRPRIVRKVLGEHEIATVQTTSIDQPAGFAISRQYWRMHRESGLPRLASVPSH